LQIRPISDENSVVYFSKDGPNSTKVIFSEAEVEIFTTFLYRIVSVSPPPYHDCYQEEGTCKTNFGRL